jgi:hypothetical protein
MKNTAHLKSARLSLIDFIINDPETKMRVGIKEVEERVKDENKNRKINAPLTTEERILLSQ